MKIDNPDEPESNAGKETNGKLIDLRKKSHERRQSKEIMLPEWPENRRGTPNSFLRSALFVAGQGKDNKDRTYLDDEIIASQQGITIRYKGSQLNQDDLTLWETLVHLAKQHPLENSCEFTAYEILKTMGQNTGALEYNRLYEGVIRLATAFININDGQYFGAMILQGARDKETQRYVLQLNKQLINLYKQSTWIDWDERLQLRKKPLAQFLHGFYSSHKSPYPVKVESLLQLSGSSIKQLWKFKQNLKTALDELVKIGFLENYSFKGDLVIVKRK